MERKTIEQIGEEGKENRGKLERLMQRIKEGNISDVIREAYEIAAWGVGVSEALIPVASSVGSEEARKALREALQRFQAGTQNLAKFAREAEEERKAKYASKPVNGTALVKVSLARGIDAAFFVEVDKKEAPRTLSARAINAIVYLCKLLPKSPIEIDAINSVADLTTTYSHVTLDAGGVSAFVKFLFGRNTRYTRQEFVTTLAELAQPLTTRVKYKKNKQYIVINEVKNVRLIDVHPYRTICIREEIEEEHRKEENPPSSVCVLDEKEETHKTAPTFTVDDYKAGIVISFGRLFYLDAKHYTPVDVQVWGGFARDLGNRYTRIMQKVLPQGEAIYAAKQRGGYISYKYTDEDDYNKMAAPNKTRRKKACARVAGAVSQTLGADTYTVDKNGITIHWMQKRETAEDKKNCANRDK